MKDDPQPQPPPKPDDVTRAFFYGALGVLIPVEFLMLVIIRALPDNACSNASSAEFWLILILIFIVVPSISIVGGGYWGLQCLKSGNKLWGRLGLGLWSGGYAGLYYGFNWAAEHVANRESMWKFPVTGILLGMSMMWLYHRRQLSPRRGHRNHAINRI